MSLGSKGSQGGKQVSEPAAQTPLQSRIQQTFSNYLFGGSPVVTGARVTQPYSYGSNPYDYFISPYSNTTVSSTPTTTQSGIKPYNERLAEDIAAQEKAERGMYDTSKQTVADFLSNLGTSLDTYRGSIMPMISANEPAATSVIPTDQPIKLRLGDFQTDFMTGTQRDKREDLQDQQRYAQQFNADLFNRLLGEEQRIAEEKRTGELALAELLAGIDKTYTSNRAENEFMNYLNALFQADEARRYGIPTVTTSESAKESPGLLDIISVLI